MSRHVVARARDIPPGSRKLFTVKGRPIGIFNLNGAYYGLLNRCPHQGGSLCEGVVTGLLQSPTPGECVYSRKGEIVRCPWHGWEFDMRTVVEGKYAAETIPVRVEEDYLVVDA